MMFVDQIKDFQERLDALYNHLCIKDKLVFIESEEIKTQKTDFWNDSKQA